MAIFKKKQTPKNETPPFENEPPISGGNTFTLKQIIETKDDIIKSWLPSHSKRTMNSIANDISDALKIGTDKNTFSFWFLLNFVVDYFCGIVPFKFKDPNVNRAVMVAIRLGIIYGNSALIKNGDKVAGLYIDQIEYDEMGYASKIKYMLGNNVLMTNGNLKENQMFINRTVDENTLIFLPYNYRVGGLVMWTPFINALKTFYEMLYVNAFQYHKVLGYKVWDPSVAREEIIQLLNHQNPVLVTVGTNNSTLNNKLEVLEFNNSSNSANGLIEFIKEYQKLYYDMIGKRQNTDRKNERNTDDEVQATQTNYDTLQHELSTNIKFFIDQVKELTGVDYELFDETPDKENKPQEQEDDQDDI